jgi:hypothetical protein
MLSNTRYVITSTGERVGYDTCFACMRPLAGCACADGPTPPRLGAGAGELTAGSEPVVVPLAA